MKINQSSAVLFSALMLASAGAYANTPSSAAASAAPGSQHTVAAHKTHLKRANVKAGPKMEKKDDNEKKDEHKFF